ncbi:MAG: DUF4349 domain-containing protein, partial [Candidatus Liptonbacteria bacterium]
MSTPKKVLLGIVFVLAAVGIFAIVGGGLNFISNTGITGGVGVYDSGFSGKTGTSLSGVYPAPSSGRDGGMDESIYAEQKNGSETTTSGVLTERKVVRSGYLNMLVENSDESAQKVHGIAKEMGGFVEESRVYVSQYDESVKNGTVTIRVPAAKFDETLAEIKKLGIKVESENVNAQDVTEHYVDLEAQLKNYRLEEQQYQEILKRAQKVEEMLKVHSQLARVRGDIERIEGQLKYLSSQVDMSSITVNLTGEADTTVLGIRWRPLYEM